MSKLATVYGGSGFLGRYITQRLAHDGWRVRVAVRRPNEALFVQTYGAVGQVEPVQCNIRDDASVRAAMQSADAVVNCVGILEEHGRNSFEAVHHHGAERVARLAREEGVAQLVHVSAIGADAAAESDYARTKGLGEAAVRDQFPPAVILRPSVMFGPEDNFFNRFARMATRTPVLFLVGAETLMQPVYVDNVAAAAIEAVDGKARHDLYELGGPEARTLRELVRIMLKVIERRRLVVNLPFWVGGIIGGILDVTQAATFGLFKNTILTRDQVRGLRHDNVVSEGMPGLADLGVDPVALESVLPDYLWVYRPSGQFAEIKDSLKNIKT